MVSLDVETLSELKLVQARFLQRLYASDDVWNHFRSTCEIYKQLLPHRKKLQRLARRYENNPLRFCEEFGGVKWFQPPRSISSQKVRGFLKIIELIPFFAGTPTKIDDLDGRSLLKQLQTLAARPGGRKPLEVYAKALELREATPPVSFHRICLLLSAGYAEMNSAKRRSERERMRSGVARLERKLNKGHEIVPADSRAN